MSTVLVPKAIMKTTNNPGEKLRIGQVAPLWMRVPPRDYGGGERQIHLLTEELVRQGHDVTLFATGDSLTSAQLKSPFPNGLVEAMSNGEAYVYEHYVNSHIEQAIRASESFDLIHFHLGCSAIPFTALSKSKVLHRIPTCITVDDEWVLKAYPDIPVVGISHRQLQSVNEFRKKNTYMIYNSCDFDLYSVNEHPGRYLAFLGRIAPHKGTHHAVNIARKMSLPLVIAGEPLTAKDKTYFKKEVSPYIDGEKVIYRGAVNDQQKNELFSNALALLFCIEWEEPFGIVMIEAMACGVPVVAFRRGSVAEVVDQGITGFYTDSPDELPGLIEASFKLNRREIRAHARKRFSYQTMVQNYIDLYYSIL